MEFRRISGLPPYVFGVIDSLKAQERRAGKDVIDLAFGNPDIPSPDIAVEKLAVWADVVVWGAIDWSEGDPPLKVV